MMSPAPLPVVLGIDDEPGDLWLLQVAFAECGREVDFRCAFGAREALGFLNADWPGAARPRPALILLDLRMPGIDGHQCLADLKADPDLCDLPVVIVTTSDLEFDVAEAKRLGADDYVVKSANLDEFIAEIRRVVDRWLPPAAPLAVAEPPPASVGTAGGAAR